MKFTFSHIQKGIALTFLVLLITGCDSDKQQEINLIPKPVRMDLQTGFLSVDSIALFGETPPANVHFNIVPEKNPTHPESYEMVVDASGITLTAPTEKGLFYGKQTLKQLYGPQGIPYVTIQDEPRFGYRGLHLDVARSFHSKDFVLKLLDVMAYYKLNTFHWHLTDNGGWRIQIDSHPKLTEEGAFRDMSNFSDWWEAKGKFVKEGTPGAYGGYYTKEEIREVVAYAATKHITVIPEIEMPGHSDEVFAAYPELCCLGKTYTGSDFCIGNEGSFRLLEDVLDEVIELFPSEYIHIGGDEAEKSTWKICPKCQKRMREEGLANVDELQSYMIKRMEKYLHSKGRRLLGWDEILEGGLAPDATVMSWRGLHGGIQAAKAGHDVIMTPAGILYMDFYQADSKTQPRAFEGFTPLKKTYSFDPEPEELSPEEKKHILGVQASTWTEHMEDPKYVEYMMFPRVLALAEMAWTPQDLRDWQDFKPRVNAHIPVLQSMGFNPFTLSYDMEVSMVVDTIKKQIEVTLDPEKYPAQIRFTTDGSIPDQNSPLYKGSIVIKDSAHIVAGIFEEGVLKGNPTEKRVDYHRGINKPVHYNSSLYKGYMAGGTGALVDGYQGGVSYGDGYWQGYLDNLDCVVDMEETTDIHKVSVRFMQITGPGVYQPGEVELKISEDGENYTNCGVIQTNVSKDEKDLTFQTYTFNGNWEGRYIRIVAKRTNPGFIFTDEIVIW